MVLADLGAQIVKVEPPAGDETRTWSPHVKGESSYFISANRGLKSICIDLRREEGRKILYELVSGSDVVLENFRPGVAEKLGVDYEELRKRNRSIVYCSIKGFGSKSHYSSRAAYDIIIQAMSGLMSTTGEEGRPPVRVSFALFDIVAGMFGGIHILAALLGRKRPSYIEVSLFDAAVFAMSYVPMAFLLTGNRPKRLGSAHPSIVPYQAFADQDGRFFVIAAANDKLWRDTCEVLGEADLGKDHRFSTNQDRVKNRDQLINILQDKFSRAPREHWIELLEGAGIPVSPVNEIAEVFSDPWIRDSGLVKDLVHKTLGAIPCLQPPVWVDGERLSTDIAAPTLGESTSLVLEDLGYSRKVIQSLYDSGVVR